jgi:para-aminobenzoate synthetase/4-amino-4-deoxychorismate lyase
MSRPVSPSPESASPSTQPPAETSACFALLDDAHTDEAVSRLYTGLLEVLVCPDARVWPEILAKTQYALQRGQYAVALFSYETGAQLQGITPHSGTAAASKVFLFACCDLLNQEQVTAWLAGQTQSQVAGIADLRSSLAHDEFSEAIAKVQDYIAAGDTYQVNYTYRLHFQTYGSAVALYQRLRQRQPVPYGALICLPDGEAVLSLSPELFVRHQQGRLLARPMKGTAAATGIDLNDERIADELANDSKNRAENLMIVDLLRNDLGRIAVTGSVSVPRLFEVKRFSSVLQMTSTVEASLQPELNLTDIMAALFPCGSITGAPKHRTMEIIREVESEARGIYTGAIGWFDAPDQGRTVGDFCLSVPIRTLYLQAPDAQGLRQGVMGVGAGIVYDSVAEQEFAECQLKAKFLTGLPAQFALFETMHASKAGGCRHLQRHLQRLQKSARFFGFEYDQSAITQALQGFCEDLPPQGAFRLRLALSADGRWNLQSGLLQDLPATVKLLIAPQACSADPLFLAHKSTLRTQYDQAWQAAEKQGAFDMLFFNQYGFLTEGGRSNLFLRRNGQWFTPPLADGVLPGIMRAVLLDDAQMQACERQLTLADLYAAEQVVLCNSLRGIMQAEIAGVAGG